jgi:hypothetical protein
MKTGTELEQTTYFNLHSKIKMTKKEFLPYLRKTTSKT